MLEADGMCDVEEIGVEVIDVDVVPVVAVLGAVGTVLVEVGTVLVAGGTLLVAMGAENVVLDALSVVVLRPQGELLASNKVVDVLTPSLTRYHRRFHPQVAGPLGQSSPHYRPQNATSHVSRLYHIQHRRRSELTSGQVDR